MASILDSSTGSEPQPWNFLRSERHCRDRHPKRLPVNSRVPGHPLLPPHGGLNQPLRKKTALGVSSVGKEPDRCLGNPEGGWVTTYRSWSSSTLLTPKGWLGGSGYSEPRAKQRLSDQQKLNGDETKSKRRFWRSAATKTGGFGARRKAPKPGASAGFCLNG